MWSAEKTPIAPLAPAADLLPSVKVNTDAMGSRAVMDAVARHSKPRSGRAESASLENSYAQSPFDYNLLLINHRRTALLRGA